MLSRALYSCSQLNKKDSLYQFAEYKFYLIRKRFKENTPKIAKYLNVSNREVQRLRVAFNCARYKNKKYNI